MIGSACGTLLPAAFPFFATQPCLATRRAGNSDQVEALQRQVQDLLEQLAEAWQVKVLFLEG